MKKIIAIVVSLFVVCLFGYFHLPISRSAQSPIGIKIFGDQPMVFLGFEPVPVVANDPVAAAVNDTINTYRDYLKGHPEDTAPNQAITAYLGLHNKLASQCATFGIQIPTLTKIPGDGSYLEKIKPLTDYLANKGWIANLAVPTFDVTTSGKDRETAFLSLGKIQLRKTGFLTSSNLPYTEDIVFGVNETSVSGMRVLSVTRKGHIYHFLDSFVYFIEKYYSECDELSKKRANPEEGTSSYYLVWGKLFLTEEDPVVRKSLMLVDALDSSAAHEHQHVVDQDLLALAPDGASNETKVLISVLAESRGLLAGIVGAKSPTLGFIKVLDWDDSREKRIKLAAEIALMNMKQPKLTLGDAAIRDERLRDAAIAGLAESNKMVALVLKHKNEKDPFSKILKKHK